VRIAGWILLLAGLLLCVSIAWAPLGFLLMGVGLVALQVAEQNRRRVKLAVVADAESSDVPPEAVTTPLTEQPVVQREIAPAPARRVTRRFNADRSPFNSDRSLYDREAWRRLVESDDDLAQLTAVLADFGPQYVDELATSYLAAPDKSRLGAIVDGIIARARGAGPRPTAAPPEQSKPSIASKREPDVAGSSNGPNLNPLPAQAPTTPLTEMEDSLIAAVAAASAQQAKQQTPIDPPELESERRDIPVTTADDDLTEMIKKFAPDSGFLRRN
jgi:hypothetical protein